MQTYLHFGPRVEHCSAIFATFFFITLRDNLPDEQMAGKGFNFTYFLTEALFFEFSLLERKAERRGDFIVGCTRMNRSYKQ